MSRFTALLNKPLLLLFEARIEGNIFGGLLNQKTKKLEYFTVGDKNIFKLIAPKKIQLTGDDAAVAINDLAFKSVSDVDITKLVFVPVGSKVFSTDGKLLGTVDDLEMDSEMVFTELFADGKKIKIDNVLSFGEGIVLTKGKWCPKIVKYVPKKVKTLKKDNRRVVILDEEKVEEQAEEAESVEDLGDDYPITEPLTLAEAIKEEKRQVSEEIDSSENNEQEVKIHIFEPRIPARIISGYGFLLGRIVTKNIFSYNRELLIKEGDIVTPPLVEKARSNGKLVELTLHSRN